MTDVHRPGVEDLRDLLRRAGRPDGVRCLLRWLAERIGCSAVLLDEFGALSESYPEPPNGLLDAAADSIASVVSLRYRSASCQTGAHSIRVLAVDAERLGPTLVVAKRGSLPDDAAAAIADVARLLRLRWRADEGDRRHIAAEQAEALTREAILHLLMVGQLDGARRAAGALGQQLPDVLRVYLVECDGVDRREVAQRCRRASGGRTWIVECPVYDEHLIVLAPAEPPADLLVVDHALSGVAGSRVRVGGGRVVSLLDTSSGYQQAFHALAAARNLPDGFASFSPRAELDALLGRAGQAWASGVVAALLEFSPERRQDPDGDELMATLRSWLDLHGRAARQLKVHRNTVAARLRRIEQILDCDLTDLGTQAELHLALRLNRLNRVSAGRRGIRELDELLATFPVRQWAESLLDPLLGVGASTLLATLRSWLRNNTRLESVAAELGVSVVGVRKRLLRVENLLGRSLLSGPSARYDLYLALRVFDAAN
ncbi:helix-turn-helix domain-containing protein [Saccharopolyspora sp. NPDC050642]|uniref:helix-turn-helix domain-containing protein n=1 Tax=Saccharopolyspora sp. NPDC050642 TaxID=3157099 RepID=UPI0033DFD3DA